MALRKGRRKTLRTIVPAESSVEEEKPKDIPKVVPVEKIAENWSYERQWKKKRPVAPDEIPDEVA